ncbi:hypothetical protein D9757_014669 [Collybiopsis confluens]|uniref:DUF6533 domain-containing protein n=1 Tax=Collybiopsis confluens TaxID=2823264 RepID=A0A8H5FKV5_9AGAR|nr:hypothetical protein D9757_014669 [Collybiopsis confluens]
MDSVDIQTVNLWLVEEYAVVASAVLWIADFIETLPTEIQTMWSRRQTGASLLLIFNRYSFLLSLLAALIINLPGESGDRECNTIGYLYIALQSTSIATTTGLFTLRVYAISLNSKLNCRVILVTAALVIASRLSVDMLTLVFSPTMSTSGSIVQGFSRCIMEQTPNSALFNKSKLAIPFIALAFDIFIFVLTLKNLDTSHHSNTLLGGASIAQLMLIDGSIYFLIMLVVGIFSVIVAMVQEQFAELNYNVAMPLAIITPFFDILPNILISRLMLNLRTFDSNENFGTISASGLHFAINSRVLGNIGAPLRTENIEEDSEDTDE